MKRLLIVVAVIAAAFAGWFYASPRLTLKNMRDAAVAKDEEKLSGYIDYEALRSDLKGDFRREMLKEMQKDEPNGFEALGAAFAMALIEPMIEAMVSPEGIEAMFDAQRARQARPGKPIMPPVAAGEDPVIERNGLDEFRVRGKDDQGSAVVFRRYGLGWKMVGIDMPESAR